MQTFTIPASPEVPTLSELAGYAYGWFETAERTGGETFVRLRDGAPEWISDLVTRAHGDMLPDDHKYQMIKTTLGGIHDSGADDRDSLEHDGGHDYINESCVSPYTGSRLAWLSSNLSRVGYIEEFYEEFGGEGSRDPGELAGQGWYMEACEVYSYVVASLAERLEEIANAMPDQDEFALDFGKRYPLPDDFASVTASPMRAALSAEHSYQKALARWFDESGYGEALAEWRSVYPEVAA
jgi:hypothetical protein